MKHYILIRACGWDVNNNRINFSIYRWVDDLDDIDTIWKEAKEHAEFWKIDFGSVNSHSECSDSRL